MDKRRLGKSDLYVTELGLGCMTLGIDALVAERIINAALEEGVNYFDTADLYDFGVNESIVGRALKSVREQVIIATKVGNRWNNNKDGWSWDPSKAYIKEAVKDSLTRLGTDYIDLFQLHGGTLDDPIDETIEAFEELVSEGLIKYYGISSIRPNVIREYASKSNISSVMMQYSILDRRPEEEALSVLRENDISVVARGPVAKGLLSDVGVSKITEKGFMDYSEEELCALLLKLRNHFGNRALTEVALRYVLHNPTIASVVAGASSVEQVKNNANAVRSQPLSEEEVSFIKEISKANMYAQHR
jgi:aryl-alcohol dehydrogenase-like predicted oxidoreductase